MLMAISSRDEYLTRLGFSFDRGGAHLARSMMLDDLRRLLQHTPDAAATREDFARAILDDNCLGKRSARSRALALRHLSRLYALDPSVAIYRAMRYLWQRDPEGQSLLACLVAYTRDPVLQLSAPFILQMPFGNALVRADLEQFLDADEQGRFSKATLKSTAQNISTTWTHAGHVKGRVRKTRSAASPTPGAAALALFLGYLTGARGQTLFETEYAKLLDCTPDRTIELAEAASRRGWIVFKRIG
ncbi:MAG: hypothetical protein KY475_01275, partial [Planctomycetes bacterium]|nr:hypothetical protein [Planctomycetota bacterium]